MNIQLVYFSPTLTTKRIVERIASGFTETASSITHLDLTNPSNRNQTHEIHADLVIVGVPCYEAKIPSLVRETLKILLGNNCPTVAVVVYGNRTIGVSLKQLVSSLRTQQFRVIATGSFIGEHSYANESLPMALNRPDEHDLAIAEQFGRELKTTGTNLPMINESNVHGQIQFLFKLLPEGFLSSFAYPGKVDPKKCTKCGLCVKKCPTDAIDPIHFSINMKKCIHCMACVKFCTLHARPIQYKMKKIVDRFMAPAVKHRREPKFFISK